MLHVHDVRREGALGRALLSCFSAVQLCTPRVYIISIQDCVSELYYSEHVFC